MMNTLTIIIVLLLAVPAYAQSAITIAIANANQAGVPLDLSKLQTALPPCGGGAGEGWPPTQAPRVAEPVVPNRPSSRPQTAVFNPPLIDALSLSADAQPTPWPGVAAMLNELKPKPNEVLLDPGCGYDARLLITACRFYGVEKAIGVEIDPIIAESARRHVKEAGLSDQIEIITGDSTKLNLDADVGLAYLWGDTLKELRPVIEKLDRFVCYGFAVPGLTMATRTASNGGKFYVWTKSVPMVTTQVPITKSRRVTTRLSRGSYCQVCGRHCSNPMAHVLQQQIVGYRTVVQPAQAGQPAPSARGGRYVARQVCDGHGHCKTVQVWVPN